MLYHGVLLTFSHVWQGIAICFTISQHWFTAKFCNLHTKAYFTSLLWLQYDCRLNTIVKRSHGFVGLPGTSVRNRESIRQPYRRRPVSRYVHFSCETRIISWIARVGWTDSCFSSLHPSWSCCFVSTDKFLISDISQSSVSIKSNDYLHVECQEMYMYKFKL